MARNENTIYIHTSVANGKLKALLGCMSFGPLGSGIVDDLSFDLGEHKLLITCQKSRY